MIKDFVYHSRGETKTRHVFVLQENETYLHGLDLDYLTETEKKDVQEVLKDHKETDISPKGTKVPPIEGYKSEWNKAWRCFKKCSFVKEQK